MDVRSKLLLKPSIVVDWLVGDQLDAYIRGAVPTKCLFSSAVLRLLVVVSALQVSIGETADRVWVCRPCSEHIGLIYVEMRRQFSISALIHGLITAPNDPREY